MGKKGSQVNGTVAKPAAAGLASKPVIIGLASSLAVTAGALGIAAYTLANRPAEAPKPERTISEGLIVEGQAIDKKASEARFTTDMNMIWTFPSGSSTSTNAVIGNSASNAYECYFEVYLNDEEQTLLYSSPVLPVGKRLETLKLDTVLPDGSYDAVCTYHILDDEDSTKELGTVSFQVTLAFIKPE